MERLVITYLDVTPTETTFISPHFIFHFRHSNSTPCETMMESQPKLNLMEDTKCDFCRRQVFAKEKSLRAVIEQS